MAERDPIAALPLRLVEGIPGEPVVCVDGALGAPGLELSHWPGNRTPRELRDDLSTGIALRFARLPAARRAELARGCTAVAINHYDTDGACALFAVLRPEAAIPRERALLDVAAAISASTAKARSLGKRNRSPAAATSSSARSRGIAASGRRTANSAHAPSVS